MTGSALWGGVTHLLKKHTFIQRRLPFVVLKIAPQIYADTQRIKSNEIKGVTRGSGSDIITMSMH